MRQEVTIILQALDNKNQSVSDLEEKTMETLNGRRNLFLFIEEMERAISFTNDLHGDRQPYYYVYLAVAHLMQEDKKSAKDNLANAIQGFKLLGLYLNEALSEWLFGIIHFEDEDMIRSQRACESSLLLMSSLITECEEKGSYNQAGIYKKYRKQIEKFIKEINSAKQKKESAHLPSYPLTHVGIPWVPIYDSVRAGRNGMIWGEPSLKNGVSVRNIEIEGKTHELYSILSTVKAIDVNINLARGVKYGVAKVEGQSMNASQPVPIEEGDYVLFSEQWQGDYDCIVIASYALNDYEYAKMVKRYAAKDHLLVSETTDTSEDYSPIHLTDEYQILGAVIAVAKPRK